MRKIHTKKRKTKLSKKRQCNPNCQRGDFEGNLARVRRAQNQPPRHISDCLQTCSSFDVKDFRVNSMRFDPLSSRLDFDNLRQVDDKKRCKKFIKTPFKMARNLIPLFVFIISL